MAEREFTIHIDGHPGHRGNVLAHAFVAKVGKLLSALGQAERRYSGKGQRQSDYEIVAAAKINPTQMTLRPVPKAMNYDPLPAFNWTFEQIERIALGEPVDDRVDAALADTLADLAKKDREDEYGQLWITRDGKRLDLDETFQLRSAGIAMRKRVVSKSPTWFEGVSFGSVVGDLRQVGDLEGEQHFVLIPPIGPKRIECTFPERERERMREYLFRTVRVSGKIRYAESSPFPAHIEMESIEPVISDKPPKHLLELRGLFKGKERPADHLEHFLYDL